MRPKERERKVGEEGENDRVRRKIFSESQTTRDA